MTARQLNLARGLRLDPDYVGGGTFALLAKKGWGKTYAMRVMAEEFAAANVPFVCLDPMDAFWGLRAGKGGGATGGIEIPIFGGPHGDVALEPTAGRLMADLVVDEGISMVLSIAHFGSRSAERSFARDFLDRLYRRNENLVHLLIDEADLFAPQKPQAGDQPLLGVTENIVRRGRNKGIGVTMGTQRPAVLNKDVLTQVDGLIVGRMLGPNDRNAIDGWVGEHGDHRQGAQIKNLLPHLPTGQAWVWIPELGVMKESKIRAARTFDSSPTRKRATSRNRKLTLADVDLHAIAGKVADTVERAKAEDPKELRKRIRQLEAELAKRPEVEPEEVKVVVLSDGDLDVEDLRGLVERMTKVAQGADAFAQRIGQQVDRAERLVGATASRPQPVPSPARAASVPRVEVPRLSPSTPAPIVDGEVKLKAGARRMLSALASLHPQPLSKSQMALLSDVNPGGGTFSTYAGSIVRSGLAEIRVDGLYALTPRGVDELAAEIGGGVPSPEQLQEMWGRKLKAGARRMLDELMKVYPDGLDKATLAERAEVSPGGGTFSTYLGSLRRNGLAVEQGGLIHAGEALFLGQ